MKLANAKRSNVMAVEEALLVFRTLAPMSWFGFKVTFLFTGKKLMMTCTSPKTIRSYCVGSDRTIYDALRKLAPKGYFKRDSELIETVDEMIRRRTDLKGERKNESVS